MRSSIRSRLVALVRAQWAGLLALFLVIAGGTAYAANTIGSADVIDNSLLSADLKNNQAVRSADVANENLTGVDIADQSGVDTCTISVRIGQLCFRAENSHRLWGEAVQHCANIDMRVPTAGEAAELVNTHNLPNLDEVEFFWTDETTMLPGDDQRLWTYVADDQGDLALTAKEGTEETVCVTTPTN